ncbi:hypothetical protein BDV24DRAFT_82938 [Aspergillus arachidicola]|uniref:Uncharacterized protein n=1 Tax=Aspergillus arachidicola TaxID=656916 RepID=A0A5N6Y335_9EURO|nr:hypothetical protein BDV24DRAFT_82938 [Aspergillus arachidicola]
MILRMFPLCIPSVVLTRWHAIDGARSSRVDDAGNASPPLSLRQRSRYVYVHVKLEEQQETKRNETKRNKRDTSNAPMHK